MNEIVSAGGSPDYNLQRDAKYSFSRSYLHAQTRSGLISVDDISCLL